MKARKIAYITALVAVELLSPSNADAGGVQEYAPQNSPQMVTISQSEYKELIQDQIRLRIYEDDDNGYSVSISEANRIIDEAYDYVGLLERQVVGLGGSVPTGPEEYVEWKKALPEAMNESASSVDRLTLSDRFSVGAGALYSQDDAPGAIAVLDIALDRKRSMFAGVLYLNGLAGFAGISVKPFK